MAQHWNVGDTTITSVVEVELPVPGEVFIEGASGPAVQSHDWLVPHFATPDGLLLVRIQLLVIESGGKRIAVDTCLGNDKERTNPAFHRLQTPFLQTFTDAGFDRDNIDVVVCTHLHTDHVGWNTMLVDGAWVPTFPNARYVFGADELRYWESHRDAQHDGDLYADSIEPVLRAGLADIVALPYAITDEIRLVSTPGHTPGHMSVEIASGDARAIITGDVLHHPVQCAEPEWASTFDSDRAMAASTRRTLLSAAADTETLVIGTHFAGPGAGYVRSHDDTWRFVAG